jgi:hypothetical protein
MRRGSRQQPETDRRWQDSGAAHSVVAYKLSKARGVPRIGEDGGVQDLSVELGLHVRQAVDIPSCGADTPVTGFLQGTAVTRVGVGSANEFGQRGSLLGIAVAVPTLWLLPPSPSRSLRNSEIFGAISYNTSMLGDSKTLRRALGKELRTIRRRGFIFLSDPSALSALAELAASLRTPRRELNDDEHLDLAEALLRQILRRRVARSHREHTGIEELLGLKEDSSRKVGVRLDRAATYLGYTDGESLRKTEIVSGHSSRKRKVVDVLLERIVSALIVVAVETDLVTPPPPPLVPPTPPVPPRPKRFRLTSPDTHSAPKKYIGPLGHANGALASEIRTVFTDGIKKALADNMLPLLTELAGAAYDVSASTRERVEALLTWAIGSSDVTGWSEKSALFALVGVDTKRQQKYEARCRRAYKRQFPTQEYDDEIFLPTNEAGIAVELSEALHELASELGIPCGPCIEDMHALGAFTPAPDPAVNEYLLFWLAICLGYVETASGGKIISVRSPPIAD